MPTPQSRAKTLLSVMRRRRAPLIFAAAAALAGFSTEYGALGRTAKAAVFTGAIEWPATQKTAAPEFQAIPIDGEAVGGKLVGLTKPWRIVLQASDRISMNGADLTALRRKESNAPGTLTGSYVLLANGNRIRATAHVATAETLRINSELLGLLEIPLERVQAIVFATPSDSDGRDRFERSLVASGRKQDVITLLNGDETTGTFVGLDEDAIRVDRAGGNVSIPRTNVRAVAFSSDLISFPRPTELFAEMLLADGSELSVLDAEARGATVRGRTTFGREFTVPLEQLTAFEFRNGRIVYLSDMEAIEYRHTPYLALSFPYQRDRCVVGGPLTLRGQVFRKGLGVHSRSEVSYAIDPSFRRFEAVVGVDDETAGQGSVIFRVLLDGREAWNSGLVTGQSAAKRVQFDIAQASRLTLVVEFGSLGDVQDHADWADARFVR
jgi:hypothetical protein